MDSIIEKIAKMLTDDPDIFNEVALDTGAIAIPPNGNTKISKKKKYTTKNNDKTEKIKYFADPVTGQAKGKTKSGKKTTGEVLFSSEKR